jgi:hypothetical protein
MTGVLGGFVVCSFYVAGFSEADSLESLSLHGVLPELLGTRSGQARYGGGASRIEGGSGIAGQ